MWSYDGAERAWVCADESAAGFAERLVWDNMLWFKVLGKSWKHGNKLHFAENFLLTTSSVLAMEENFDSTSLDSIGTWV